MGVDLVVLIELGPTLPISCKNSQIQQNCVRIGWIHVNFLAVASNQVCIVYYHKVLDVFEPCLIPHQLEAQVLL